jgi:hypothetical protein
MYFESYIYVFPTQVSNPLKKSMTLLKAIQRRCVHKPVLFYQQVHRCLLRYLTEDIVERILHLRMLDVVPRALPLLQIVRSNLCPRCESCNNKPIERHTLLHDRILVRNFNTCKCQAHQEMSVTVITKHNCSRNFVFRGMIYYRSTINAEMLGDY